MSGDWFLGTADLSENDRIMTGRYEAMAKLGGYMGKILRVDLTKEQITEETLPMRLH